MTSATLSSGESASLPDWASGQIKVSSSTDALGLGFPAGLTGVGTAIAPSTTLYGSPDNFSVAATITSSGVRESVAMQNSLAPSVYSFPVTLPAGEFLASNPDGSVSVMKSFSGGSVSLGMFQAPWAKDAAGNFVTTTYTIQGDTLVQHVDVTTATVFPVVADPYITWGWGPYLNLTGGFIQGEFPQAQASLDSVWGTLLPAFGVGAVCAYLAYTYFGYLAGPYGAAASGAFGIICTAAEALFQSNLFPAAQPRDVVVELQHIVPTACYQYYGPSGRPIIYNPGGFPASWTKVPNSNCNGE